MTATDELRRLLDERGVKHEGSERSVRWRDRNGVIMQAFPLTSGELGLEVWSCTPEQAIAATLGGGYQGFWTYDGTLHIELPKLPESILVRLPDKRDREVRSARVWRYTLGDADATGERHGVGTCHISVQDNLAETEGMGDVWLECDACNWQMPLEPSTPRLNFCPNCGKRVVE